MPRTQTTRRSLGWLAAIASLASLAGSSRAEDNVLVRTVRDERYRGTVASFSLEDGLRLQTPDRGAITVGTRDIVYLRQRGEMQTKAAATVYLSDGSRIVGDLLNGAEGMLRVRHAWLGDITLPLDGIRSIRAGVATDQDADAAESPELDDVVVMKNGDRSVGTLLGVREGAIWIESDLGETLVPLDVFSEVRLVKSNAHVVARGDRLARLHLSDNSLLTADRVEWKDGSLAVRIRGHEATIPEEAVREVDIIGGRWVWLSELSPARVEQTPLWTVGWPMRVNRNVRGGPIVIDGRRYERGIGVHSACRLVYRLDDVYQTFVVVPGLDDNAGRFADVTARVIVDGAVRFEHEHLTPGRSPGQIRISLDGASTLELDVQFGHYGDVEDRFDWADAALIRK